MWHAPWRTYGEEREAAGTGARLFQENISGLPNSGTPPVFTYQPASVVQYVTAKGSFGCSKSLPKTRVLNPWGKSARKKLPVRLDILLTGLCSRSALIPRKQNPRLLTLGMKPPPLSRDRARLRATSRHHFRFRPVISSAFLMCAGISWCFFPWWPVIPCAQGNHARGLITQVFLCAATKWGLKHNLQP
jgi:hypothetical protein